MKRFFIAIALLFAVFPSYAQKSKSTLSTEINTNFPDNSVGAITPSIARSTFNDFLNSWQQYSGVNAQIGTSYIIQTSDYGQLVTLSNSSSVAVSLPQATGSFATFSFYAGNLGTGNVTITPTTSTINGASTLVLTQGQSAFIVSDGVNWQVVKSGFNSSNLTAGAGLTITGGLTPTISITNAVTGASVGSANAVPSITYNAQGEITASSIVSPTTSVGNITGILSNSVVGNNTGSTANGTSLNNAQLGALLCAPVRTVFLTGVNATFTSSLCNGVLPIRIEVEMVGSGGGGAGSGTSPAAAGTGTNTCWNTSGTACSTPTFAANGGALGNATPPSFAAGGTTSGCDLGLTGGVGGAAVASVTTYSGSSGGNSFFGGAGPGAGPSTNPGGAAAANSGSGGGGDSTGGTANSGGGGGAGGYCRKILTSVLSTYVYTIGTGGNAGGAGGSGAAGGAGANGLIQTFQYWQ